MQSTNHACTYESNNLFKKKNQLILFCFLSQLLEQNFCPTKQRDISVNVKETATISTLTRKQILPMMIILSNLIFSNFGIHLNYTSNYHIFTTPFHFILFVEILCHVALHTCNKSNHTFELKWMR